MNPTSTKTLSIDNAISCSLFHGCKDNKPKHLNLSWINLREALRRIYPVTGDTRADAKNRLPALSPAAYPEGATRGDRNILSLQLFALDFDNTTEAATGEVKENGEPVFRKMPIAGAPTLDEVSRHLTDLGYTHFGYTSYSSTPEHQRFRMIVLLERPSDGRNWSKVSEMLIDRLGMRPWYDQGCLDIGCLHRAASLYYLAGYWDQEPEAKDRIQFATFDGSPLQLPAEEDLAGFVMPEKPINPERKAWAAKQKLTHAISTRSDTDSWFKDFNIQMSTMRPDELVRRMGCKVQAPVPHKDGFMVRCSCPFTDEHTHGEDNYDAAVFYGGSGWPGFYCFHDSCADKGLRELCLKAGAELVQACGQPYQPLQVNRHLYGDAPNASTDTECSDEVLVGEVLDAEESEEGEKPSKASRMRSIMMARLTASRIEAHSIQFTDQGMIDKLPCNLEKILLAGALYQSLFRMNELTLKPEIRVPGYPHLAIDDWDNTVPAMRNHLRNNWGTLWTKEIVSDSLSLVAAANSYHPVRDHLLRLPEWDGVDRIPMIRDEILGANQAPDFESHMDLYASFLRCTLIGAVRRVLEPGCKMDSVTILYGPQAARKSTFWRVMAIKPEWFNDSKIHIESPEGAKVLHNSWITELSEIDDMTRKKSAEALKAFVSISTDQFRPSYGRTVRSFQRKCIMVGSTNTEQVLNDATGSRRFWVIPTSACINIDLLQQHLDQIWAQALKLCQDGEPHYLSQEMEARRVDQSERYQIENRYADLMPQILGFYLTTPSGDGVTLNQIFSFLGGKTEAGKGFADPKQVDRIEMANCLRAHGWTEKVKRVQGKTARCWTPPAAEVEAARLSPTPTDQFTFPRLDFGSDPFQVASNPSGI